MGVGVGVAGLAVSGPAGVGDALGGGLLGLADVAAEIGDAADFFLHVDAVCGEGGYAAGVVSTVFESAEPVDKDRPNFTGTNISYNTTHI